MRAEVGVLYARRVSGGRLPRCQVKAPPSRKEREKDGAPIFCVVKGWASRPQGTLWAYFEYGAVIVDPALDRRSIEVSKGVDNDTRLRRPFFAGITETVKYAFCPLAARRP
jgi:hypothetical protein